jgi:hypothetical protein
MNSLLPIPNNFQPRFEQMWRSACRVCDNIRAYQPDLLLALMHSGWGPVFAAQILWQHTQSSPFPPVARTNLGREKIDVFEHTFNLPSECFPGEYASDFDIGKLLAWLTSRTDWREQLCQQVAEAMQHMGDPQRILVVDDCIHEGSTSILTLGLLDWVYPQTTVRFLNADSWYRSHYTEFLLELLSPGAQFFPDAKIPSDEVRMQLGQVAVGSENVSIDSLYWRPISADSPAVQALMVYRPPTDWLQASQQVYAVIANHIAERSASYVPGEPDPHHFNFGLRKPWLMMRDIWLEQGITRRQAERRYELSSREVIHILENWVENEDVTLVGHGRGARYVIPAPLQRQIDKLDDPPEAVDDAYWLIPGKLIFGEQPWYSENPEGAEWARREIRHLLDHGVDCWLDVQIIQEAESPSENPLFVEEAKAIGKSAMLQVIPLVLKYLSKENFILIRRGRPNRKDIRPILDQMDRFLAEGRVIYLSASDPALRGILAGCYLARHGQAGRAALEALQACRATAARGWRREPANPKARRFVRSWPAGL